MTKHSPPLAYAALARTALDDAVAHHRAGQPDEAATAYRRVLALDPTNGDALHLLGLIEARRGRLTDGIAGMARAVRLLADTGPVATNLRNLAAAVAQAPDIDVAFAYCRARAEADPADSGAVAPLCMHYVQSGQHEAILALADRLFAAATVDGPTGRALARQALTAHIVAFEMAATRPSHERRAVRLARRLAAVEPPGPAAYFILACAANRTGGRTALAALERSFLADRQRPGFADGSSAYWRLHLSRFSAGFYRDLANLDDPTPRFEVRRAAGEGRPVVLVGCDGVYWERFGESFAASWRRFAPGTALHVHLVNPAPELVERLLSGLPDVGLSVETTALGQRSFHAGGVVLVDKIYYACARYLVAPALARRYRTPLLVTDVDALFTGPPDALFERAGRADAVLWRRPELGLTREILAGCVTVDTTRPAVLAWLDLTARYLAYFFHREAPSWFLDQAALYGAWRHLERMATPLRVDWLDPATVENVLYFPGGDVAAKAEAILRRT